MSSESSHDLDELRSKRLLGRIVMLLGASPVLIMLLAMVLLVVVGCGFDGGPDYCHSSNPIIEGLEGLVMIGVLGIPTLPVLIAGRIMASRADRAINLARHDKDRPIARTAHSEGDASRQ